MAEGTYELLSGHLTETHSRLDEKARQLRAASGQRQPDAEALAIELEVLQAIFTDLSVGVLIFLLGPARYRAYSRHPEAETSGEPPSDAPPSSN